jgi:hypothetical protein
MNDKRFSMSATYELLMPFYQMMYDLQFQICWTNPNVPLGIVSSLNSRYIDSVFSFKTYNKLFYFIPRKLFIEAKKLKCPTSNF